MTLTHVSAGHVEGELETREHLFAPNGYLHAGALVTFADTCCGVGCQASLPAGKRGFTTLELKTNFLAGIHEVDVLHCVARLAHGGRTTQVWDATVTRGDGKQVAIFRCTQMLLGRSKTGPSTRSFDTSTPEQPRQ